MFHCRTYNITLHFTGIFNIDIMEYHSNFIMSTTVSEKQTVQPIQIRVISHTGHPLSGAAGSPRGYCTIAAVRLHGRTALTPTHGRTALTPTHCAHPDALRYADALPRALCTNTRAHMWRECITSTFPDPAARTHCVQPVALRARAPRARCTHAARTWGRTARHVMDALRVCAAAPRTHCTPPFGRPACLRGRSRPPPYGRLARLHGRSHAALSPFSSFVRTPRCCARTRLRRRDEPPCSLTSPLPAVRSLCRLHHAAPYCGHRRCRCVTPSSPQLGAVALTSHMPCCALRTILLGVRYLRGLASGSSSLLVVRNRLPLEHAPCSCSSRPTRGQVCCPYALHVATRECAAGLRKGLTAEMNEVSASCRNASRAARRYPQFVVSCSSSMN